MKKVAIMTLFYKNYNYGGILQSFALQNLLEKKGYYAKQIMYEYQDVNKKFLMRIIKKSLAKDLYCFLRGRRNYFKVKHQNKLIEEFSLSIPHTKRMNKHSLVKLNDEFDCFICGSDQIWNPIGWQTAFFLDFVNPDKKKISYAASIAKNQLSEQELKYILSNIASFSDISIREKNLKDILEKELFRTVHVMPDPTLLLSPEEWEIIAEPVFNKDEYLFAYFLGDNMDSFQQAKKFAHMNNLKFYSIPYLDEKHVKWMENNNDYANKVISVKQFLGLIKNAKYVVTDSFHGTVFSVMFRKKLFVQKRFSDEDNNSMNSRLDNLLELLELKDIYGNNLNMQEVLLDYNYKYDEVHKKIEEIRNQGIAFLVDSLEAE